VRTIGLFDLSVEQSGKPGQLTSGPSLVGALSNSLNKVAGDWPFCMSVHATDVGREVQRYVEGLCEGRDIARNKTLTINLDWRSDAL
jgi:hypothetical protein